LERLTTATAEPALEPPAELTTAAQGLAAKPLSPSRLAWRRFRRHKLAMVSAFVLLIIIVLSAVPSLFTSYSPNQLLRTNGDTGALMRNIHPGSEHWFGTDRLGRDEWTRLLYGGRISLAIGVLVALISTAAGAIIGALAGYFGRWVDNVLMRLTDLFLALPLLVFLIIAGQLPARQPWAETVMGEQKSMRAVVTLIALFFWMPVARVVRGLVLSLKEKEFVEAARAAGASDARIILRHLLPNCAGQLIISATLAVAAAILLESVLSFLGFGVDPVATPTWGNIIDLAQLERHPALVLAPGLAIIITVLAVNFVGDGLRDALDPKQLSV
jgi:peptide/nickel transport system permease protein